MIEYFSGRATYPLNNFVILAMDFPSLFDLNEFPRIIVKHVKLILTQRYLFYIVLILHRSLVNTNLGSGVFFFWFKAGFRIIEKKLKGCYFFF